jgi:hypothetical protein
MSQTTAKIIDLQEYRKSRQELQDELNELLNGNKATNTPRYQNIMLPCVYSQHFIIPDVYAKLWNKFWAIGFTIFVLISLL